MLCCREEKLSEKRSNVSEELDTNNLLQSESSRYDNRGKKLALHLTGEGACSMPDGRRREEKRALKIKVLYRHRSINLISYPSSNFVTHY